MNKKIVAVLCLASAAAAVTAHAQMLFLENFESGTTATGYVSSPNGNYNATFGATAGQGTASSTAGSLTFDNAGNSGFYNATIGAYENSNAGTPVAGSGTGQGTSSAQSDYTISFDIRATNLVSGTTATFTPVLQLIDNFDYQNTITLTAPTSLTLTGGYQHYTFNLGNFSDAFGPNSPPASSTFGYYITTHIQTSFSFSLNDLDTAAFNSGASAIYIDNLNVSQVPEPGTGWLLVVGLGLAAISHRGLGWWRRGHRPLSSRERV